MDDSADTGPADGNARPAHAPQPKILALVRDFLFATKISSTARSLSIEITLFREPALLAACTHANGAAAALLIVDLNQDGAIPAAIAWGRAGGRRVIGFVSHVDDATIHLAAESGAIEVMPRSRFSAQLPAILTGAAKPPM